MIHAARDLGHVDIAFDVQKYGNKLRITLKEHYIMGTIKQWSSSESEIQQLKCSVHVLRHVWTRYFAQYLKGVVKIIRYTLYLYTICSQLLSASCYNYVWQLLTENAYLVGN